MILTIERRSGKKVDMFIKVEKIPIKKFTTEEGSKIKKKFDVPKYLFKMLEKEVLRTLERLLRATPLTLLVRDMVLYISLSNEHKLVRLELIKFNLYKGHVNPCRESIQRL